METSPGYKGGDVSYARYKLNAEKLLKQEQDIIVTSLIDFFRLKTDFPNFQQSTAIADKVVRVQYLEQAIAADINNHRFVPYIQLHEFEGLLFSSNNGFDYIPDIPPPNRLQLNNAVNAYANPEFLNDGPQTAPSKRLIELIPGYQKTFHGPIIADVNTIGTMLGRCDRFRAWIERLITLMTPNKNAS